MNERSFECLLYGITARTVSLLIEKYHWSEDEALRRFTTSKLYTYLEREETKVWYYSAWLLAELFQDEQTGQLVLPAM